MECFYVPDSASGVLQSELISFSQLLWEVGPDSTPVLQMRPQGMERSNGLPEVIQLVDSKVS